MSEQPDRVAMVSDLAALEERLEQRFDQRLDQRLDERLGKSSLDERLGKFSEEIRRHFDMVAEQMRDDMKVFADATAHHTAVLDNHEARLKTLERKR